jgi:type I restriction enzyme S subunit
MTRKTDWTTVKSGDVVRLNTDRIADPEAEGIERYVGIEHIEPEDLRIRRWGLVEEGTTFTNYFKPGQVLFVKRRAYQRKVAVAEFEGVCSGDIYVLEPKYDHLLPELLPFICQTDAFFAHAVNTSAGSLSPRTNWKQLAQYRFALPSLTEQRRVAEVLLASAEMIESYRSLANRSERQYLSLVLHIFQVGVRDGKLNEYKHFRYPAHWELRRVDECFELQLGKMSSAKARAGDNQKLYLKNNNVLWGKFDFANLSSMSFNES